MVRNEKYHGKEALPQEYPTGALRHRDYTGYQGRKGRCTGRTSEYYRERTPEEQSLYTELDAYLTNGCILRLNGRMVRPDQVVRACFRGPDSYMRDFVIRAGLVQEICFDRVRQ